MPGFDLSEEVLQDFLLNGELISIITLPAISINVSREHGQVVNLSPLEEQALAKAIRDLKQIDDLLNNLHGSPLEQCPGMNQELLAYNGYKFKRFEYIGRHIIQIERDRDNFYWSIGVKTNSGDGAITGYYNNGTNGSLVDVTEALENTVHLFPAPLRRSARLERMRMRF